MEQQTEMFDENPAYEAFIEKFKPKKTTDDCYTPENIYEAVAGWVEKEYGVARESMIRPFWPGGDYEHMEYPAGCCVVDNPPFSIITPIERYYLRRNIRFFLFAPTLTLFGGVNVDACFIPVGAKITYANGAMVNTSFCTNLDDCRVRSAPDLYKIIERENEINEKQGKKALPKYAYPPHVLTAAAAYQYSHYGIPYRLEKQDCVMIDGMDEQKEKGKKTFGRAFLLSERAAAERAAAERAAAERAAAHQWQLSEREKAIVAGLGKKEKAGIIYARNMEKEIPGQVRMDGV